MLRMRGGPAAIAEGAASTIRMTNEIIAALDAGRTG
jgi:hypothetical protein